jgi:hypothetical protein
MHRACVHGSHIPDSGMHIIAEAIDAPVYAVAFTKMRMRAPQWKTFLVWPGTTKMRAGLCRSADGLGVAVSSLGLSYSTPVVWQLWRILCQCSRQWRRLLWPTGGISNANGSTGRAMSDLEPETCLDCFLDISKSRVPLVLHQASRTHPQEHSHGEAHV